MEFLPMNESHVEQIAQLETICFTDPWSINSILYELKNPLSYWVVAVDMGKVVGYVGSQTVLGETDMMNIAVAPEYRRQGLAEEMINRLVAHLRAQQVHCLTLEVRASNQPAIQLYGKLDFHQVGRRPNYYRNPKEDALILRKEWQI